MASLNMKRYKWHHKLGIGTNGTIEITGTNGTIETNGTNGAIELDQFTIKDTQIYCITYNENNQICN